MSRPLTQSRLLPGFRGEQLRLRADTRDGLPVVRLDVLAPLAAHTDALSVKGPPVIIPAEHVNALMEALYAAKVEAVEGVAPATRRKVKEAEPSPPAVEPEPPPPRPAWAKAEGGAQ